MSKIDKLGRIVIPINYRKKYGLSDGASIDFLDEGEGITVKPSAPYCKLCKSKIDEKSALPLCESCIKEVVKKYNEK